MTDPTDRVWIDSMAEAYERLLVPTVFQPFAVDLAARVVRGSPRRVLELAAGTGVLARQILKIAPGTNVTATDLNEAMVRFGQETVPGARWSPADAMSLPFGDGAFDAVVCQFGAMFFPDRVAAFAEARRVLAPGGRLLMSLWDTLETHDFEAAVVAALRRIFPDDPPLFLAETPHGCSDAQLVVAELTAAGFGTVHLETITVLGTADSVSDLAVGYCTGTPLRAAILARDDLDATAAALAGEMVDRFGPGPLTGRMGAHVFEGLRAE